MLKYYGIRPVRQRNIDNPYVWLDNNIAKFSYVSFDIFDTALERINTHLPVDIFHSLGNVVTELTSISSEQFARIRIDAEAVARQKGRERGVQEVTLGQIYQQFRVLFLNISDAGIDDSTLTTIMNTEIQIEQNYLRPIESTLEIYHNALARGKKVIFISDYYMGSAILGPILNNKGYSNFHKLYVSCDCGKTKSNGSLYDFAIFDLGIDRKNIIHIGDNAHSDCRQASFNSIANVHINNPSENYEWRNCTRDVLPRNSFESSYLKFLSREIFGDQTTFRSPHMLNVKKRIGVETLSTVLIGFVSWLYESIKAQKIDKIFFCSRDGRILKKVFDMLQERFGFVAGTSYLCLSRQVIYRAQAKIDSMLLEKFFIQNWHKITPAQALSRWNLAPDLYAKVVLDCGFTSLSQELLHDDINAKTMLCKLFAAVHADIAIENYNFFDKFADYLLQEGLGSSTNCALVDIGWHGSFQKGLSPILEKISPNHALTGFYLGLFVDKNTAGNLPAYGYFCSDNTDKNASKLMINPSLIEVLFSACHGSTKDYATNSTKTISPVFEECSFERNQYIDTIQPIQSSALQLIEHFLFRNDCTEPGVIRPAVAIAGLYRLLSSPDADERALLSSLSHVANYGESNSSLKLSAVW